MKVGLINTQARISSKEVQENALLEAGCERFCEIGGINAIDRSELDECLESLQEGDTLVVWRLDIFGKPLAELMQLLSNLSGRGIFFYSIEDRLTSKGLMGQMVQKVIRTLKNADHNVQRVKMEQVRKAAMERGVRLGRKQGSVNRKNRDKPMQCKVLYENGSSVNQIMTLLNIRTSGTVYRYLKRMGVQLGDFKERKNLTQKELTELKKDLFDSHHQLNLFD